MANPNGTPASLVPAEPGNLRAYSGSFMDERVGEIVAELLALPHVRELDRRELARSRT